MVLFLNKLYLLTFTILFTSFIPFTFAIEKNSALNGKTLANNVCSACHGSDGNSPTSLNPIIAGQHYGYLYKQLKNFKSGKRDNQIMLAIASTLSDNDMRDLSLYFSEQKFKVTGSRDDNLIELGEKIYKTGISKKNIPACKGCHMPNGKGIPSEFPRIGGQYETYIITQLNNFKASIRKNDKNEIMRDISKNLSEKEILALSIFLSGLN